ncbi:aspartyl/asparaginyl beta-hydroxylase domain-containing protein [Plantactinospora sp. CA-294935]|uniref:aspartyl/asparaginyl beta-hydroxylase domain-containing protein n=1 Tax=Plantactinospora sp. CA-294935 TaxID=3240012 RepID=UPI003D8B34A5
MATTTVRWPEVVRRSYSQLVDALTTEGAPEVARQCADLAVEQGVWRHPLQRPVHYISSLPPRPVYDPADFWFCAYLEENYPQIRAELDAVTDPAASGFLPVEESMLGAGRWEEITFYEAGHRFDDACARFPVTSSIVEGIPEAAAAGIGVVTLSWLYPGTRIVPHCGGSNARLRVHLGLQVPDGARLRVGDQVLGWQEGRCLVFDDSFEHEVWHDGDRPRVVLLMDVCHPELDPADRDVMLAGRISFEERATRFLAEHGLSRVQLGDAEEVRVELDQPSARQVSRYLRGYGAESVELRDGRLLFRPDRAAAGEDRTAVDR